MVPVNLRVEPVMGTMVSIEWLDGEHQVVDDVVAWLHTVDRVFSPYRHDSVVSQLGRNEITEDETSPMVTEVLQRCRDLRTLSGGAFDPWALPAPNGTRFDPCGFVKGWSIERAADWMVTRGISDVCINAGGDIAVRGTAEGGQPWRMGIRHPGDPRALAMVLQAEGPLAVATSASYERGAHIIHPRHGTPTAEVASATVVGRSLADADAFATTLFVMGIGGLYWVDDQPGYGAMVITHDGAVLSTARFDRHRVPLAA